ncbi:MAG: oligoendopeptidase F [Clostridia bacterium]|nr:oligoendopeptidase F [Clostridia bacterium]
MKKRREILDKYKWNFEDYFKSDDEWTKTFHEFSKEILEVKKYYGKLQDKQNILSCFRLLERLSITAEALAIYANCQLTLDVSNPKYQAFLSKIEQVLTEKDEISSFVVPQLCALSDEFLDKLSLDSSFADFSKIIRDVKREKKHILPEESEKLLSSTGAFSSNFSSNFTCFQDGDLKFKAVLDKRGKQLAMSNSQAMIYLQSADEVLRQNAYRELQSAYGRFNNFLTSNYLGSVKKDAFYAKAKKFSSATQSALFYEEVEREVYNNLLSNVEKNLHLNQKFFEIKRKMFSLKQFKLSDLFFCPLRLSSKYSYEEATEIVCNALSVLGEDYVNYVKDMVEKRMVDVFPTENKTSGAYETMAVKKSPRVLLNFVGTFNDVSTLAHELGHAVHSILSNNNQSVVNSGYTIFLAEIASTVNELLLNNFMSLRSKSDDEKKYYLHEFLMECYSTIYRQTMFANFEEIMHKKVEANAELSTDILNSTYLELVKKYFGNKVKIFDEVKFEWSRIPHFYNAFYVYKYATGFISAINIVNNILAGKISVADYKKFLSAGCTDTPTELLKIVKVNLTTDEPYKIAFAFIEEKLHQFSIFAQKKK